MQMSDLKKLLKKALEESLMHDKPVIELRSAVKRITVIGYEKEDVLNEFEALRNDLSNEAEEDIILDVMDFITGWCSPHMRI